MARLEIGATGTASLTVTAEHTAQAFGSGNVPVFSTPRMIALMEQAAVVATDGRLGAGDTTVGTRLDVLHFAATPIGDTVRAEARLVAIEGRKLRFEVAAFDSHEKVGEGSHERAIVNEQKFLAKVRAKTPGTARF